MVDASPSGKAFLFHRQILINLIMDLINRTWNSHRYALNGSINIPLLIPLYPSHHTWCQFALSTRKTCRPHGASRASDCPSCGTGCGDAVPHLYPHCWNLHATHWGIGRGPQLDSSQLNSYTPYKNWDGKWDSLTAMTSWQLRSHILIFVILPAFGSSLFF